MGKLRAKATLLLLGLFLAAGLLLAVQARLGAAQAQQSPIWTYRTDGGVYSVAISGDGSYIVAGGGDHKVYLFPRSDNTPQWSYETGEAIMSVTISSDGSYAAAGGGIFSAESGWQGKVYLFSRASSTPVWSYQISSQVKSVVISSDGLYIAASDGDGKVYLFSRADNTLRWSYTTGSIVESVAISSNGAYIAAGSWDHNVYLFSRENSTPLWSYTTGYMVGEVAISSDGNYIAAGSYEDKVYLFSKSSSTPVWSYTTGGGAVSVAISSDGGCVVAGSGDPDYKVYLFPSSDNTPQWSYAIGSPIKSIAITSDGLYIAAGLGDKVYLFPRSDNTPQWSYAIGHDVNSVSVSSDGAYVAAGCSGQNVYSFSGELKNPPNLTSGSVSPESGSPGTTFTYQVTYTDNDNDAPSYIKVYIDGTGHDMTKTSGDYATGATYKYSWATTSGDIGSHDYYFKASDNTYTAQDPAADNYPGPSVTEGQATALAVSPVAFQLAAGGSTTLTATLTSNNLPLVGKTINWSTSAGTLSENSGTTDSSGQVSVTYTAPNYETTVAVAALFAGDNQYRENQASVPGIISEPGKPESTSIGVIPTTFQLQTGTSDTFTATLTSGGQPLAGKLIQWSATAGTATPSSGYTDTSGRATTTYYAPDSPVEEVAVVASFAGDNWYEAGENSSAGEVVSPGAKPATIQITPSSFSIDAGDSIQLTAVVTSDGLPVQGKLVTWFANAGSFSPQSAYTDAEGKVATTYIAAEAKAVTISASFAGDNAHQAAQISQQSTVNLTPLHKRAEFWGLVVVGVAGGITFFMLKKRGLLIWPRLLFKKRVGFCRKCGAPLPPGVKFCRMCGLKLGPPMKLVKHCRKCGAPLPPGVRFCRKCGARLK